VREPVATVDSPRSRALTDTQVALLLVIPALVLFSGVVLYPLGATLVDSLFRDNLLTSSRAWVGLRTIEEVATSTFVGDLVRTSVFTGSVTAIAVVLGLALALALNTRIPGRAALRGLFLVPWVVPSVAASFLWAYIFDTNYGPLNGLLVRLHLSARGVGWLGDPHTAMLAVVIARAWAAFPWLMVIFLAGLQTIPGDLYEAAEVDGAGRWRRFRAITLPSLRPILYLALLLEIAWNLQHIDTMYIVTSGGPARATTTFSLDVYQEAFSGYDIGHAAATGVLWMAILSVFLVLYLRVLDRRDEQ
jgi:multiple sugar transport system permease protein